MGKAEFDFRTRIGDALHHGRGIPESALAITIAVHFRISMRPAPSLGIHKDIPQGPQYNAVVIQRNASRMWSTETHVHYYFLNLLICDLILSTGM